MTELYYFCFGSNMLTRRMHVNIKSASPFARGRLPDYTLAFSGYAPLWDGATANIVPQTQSQVNGFIYKLSPDDLARLDEQEIGYKAINVEVQLLPEEKDDHLPSTVTCRTYVQTEEYSAVGNDIPSKRYKEVLEAGAREHRLPEEYIEQVIKATPDNGRTNCGPAELVL